MADVRCPNCGENNPDLLDVCQFCQTPLKPDPVLRFGEQPTKKNTGELEPILPEWLKDVRQQARASAEEDAAQAASQPKAQKEEPLDFLAGLASQSSSSDEEEVPDWLASINPKVEPPAEMPSSSEPTQETDFLAQFDRSASEPVSEDIPSAAVPEKDELSEWFTQAAGQPHEIVELDHGAEELDKGWVSSFESPPSSTKDSGPPEEEDLSWLRNLEEAAKQTGDLKAPKVDTDWMANREMPSTPSQPSSSPEDLSWLDKLGGIEEASQQPLEQNRVPQEDLSWLNQLGGMPTSHPAEKPQEEAASQEDLSWLSNLGSTPEAVQPFDAAPDKPISPQPFASEEDRNWLNNLGTASESESPQPFSAPAPEAADKPFSQEDLSWLNELGGIPESERPADTAHDIPSSPQEDLSRLKGLGETEEPASKPRQTAPLGKTGEQREPEPDWLKSAAEVPSMPAPGDLSMDWFTQQDQSGEHKTDTAEGAPQAPPFGDIFATPSEPGSLSHREVDSLFSTEMPDWLSRPEPGVEETASPPAMIPPAEGPEALAPVELPSWVQAMRPVEAVISEAGPEVDDQPEEKEGPLAGLRGVIPGAPMGASIKPKPVSLMLQATAEQQASAQLLEQILASETTPRPLIDSSFVAAQHVLRWVLAGLFVVVLGVVVSLRSQSMPISPSLPVEGFRLSDAVMSIPAGANVLVVIDYEPSLAGEMEAIGRPLLEQLVFVGHPNLSFISTSPNGTALAERLLASADINTPDGFGYHPGVEYHNLGFLPGGSAGVLGFMEAPGDAIPTASVNLFSEYAALIVMTDQAESGRIWVEQLQSRKQVDALLASQPLMVVASAQAGPLLQPYVSSGQVSGMISGLSDAARYEFVHTGRPGMARSYWDAFGVGLALASGLIIVGSLWSLLTGMRARRMGTEQE